MKKRFVEIVTKVSVTEQMSVELPCGTLTIGMRRVITRVQVVETDEDNLLIAVFAEGLNLIECFETVNFKAVEDGLVGQNESGSLKVEMRFRELHVVGLVLA